MLGGCSPDSCRALCNSLATELGRCLPERSLDWEDLGAADVDDWSASCLDDWESARADLEGREVSASLDQCDSAAVPECDVLLALYGL